jgi:arylsulfatase A-like enzyme
LSSARSAPLVLVVALALGLAACGEPPPVPRDQIPERLRELGQPNIVFVLVDTLRCDWTSPYGFDIDTMPELDRWAKRGVTFERVRAQSSWTKVSMASTLTSLWPRSHGVQKSTDGLAPGAFTLAEAFQGAGYRTWGIQTNGWLDQSFGFQQGFDRYTFPVTAGAMRFQKSMIWPHGDRVLEEMGRFLESRQDDQPFFLYVHFMDVHQYAAPPEFQKYGRGTREQYLASIRWVDDVLQRMREMLEAEGLLGRTVMLFGSDHGETFGENGVHGHAINVLTPVLRVPLVMRFPFAVEPVRVREQVRNIDIAPTLTQIAGIPEPATFEGSGLIPLVVGAEVSGDRVSYASLPEVLFPNAHLQASVNDGSWSFTRNLDEEDGREYLFDRRVDPDENVNLLSLEPEQALRMRGLLDAYLASEPRPDTVESDVRIDPTIADKLRALGYLGN